MLFAILLQGYGVLFILLSGIRDTVFNILLLSGIFAASCHTKGCNSLSFVCGKVDTTKPSLMKMVYSVFRKNHYGDICQFLLQICTNCPQFRPAYYWNVNTNANGSLQTSYDHYKCLVINKNGLHMLRICFFANFRSMFLIFASSQECFLTSAIFLRSLRIGAELHS